MKITRVVGLDLGTKTLGVAISDPLKISSQGITTITFEVNHYQKAIDKLAELVKDYQVECFILGNPKHMNGEQGDSSKRSINFKKRLEKHFQLPVVLWDERLSSVLVNKAMISLDDSRKKRKQKIDMLAASSILQEYLDSQK